jgi:hypothetical protein
MDFRSESGPCSPYGTGTVQIITDPDPGGPKKTYGSGSLLSKAERYTGTVPGFVLAAALWLPDEGAVGGEENTLADVTVHLGVDLGILHLRQEVNLQHRTCRVSQVNNLRVLWAT